MNWRIKVVLPLVKGNLLDIGCGTNEFVKAYRKAHPDRESKGVDVEQWGGVDIVVSDSSEIPLDDESFDTITCLAALNYVPNRDKFLLEVKRILDNDGVFIISMIPPSIAKIWHRIRSPWDVVSFFSRGMKSHEEFGFTSAQVRELFRKAGLDIVYEKRFMFGINTAYVAKKIF
ncbi:methyltransferase domain-containing protein [Maridesulfovibrio sp.]|uniref:class I SAM-dependent methyltransferase n=1 Tax=Maridesulfovibrio sp. TaxID=2795000 RepID=UPI0029CA7312|nr:methyltransferase domain-containing protein [Maridesulfovibrio sp.]